MKTTTETRSKTVTTVAARIAGEDIAKGDYVTNRSAHASQRIEHAKLLTRNAFNRARERMDL